MNRSTAYREKNAAALSSVIAAVVLTTLKLIVGLQTNSLGILSEAAHSGLDLIASIITLYAVRISEKPPDQDHQYGHGKVENISALIETILLVATCASILYEAVKRLITHETHIQVSVYSFGVIILAIIIDFGRSRVLSRTAKKYNSQALEADALHFSSDIWTSLVVLLGLACVANGYNAVDPIAAILVAILVLFVSYRLGRKTIDALTDRVPQGLYQEVWDAVQRIEGIEDIVTIRLRTSGAKVFVDASVTIRRTIPFERAHGVVNAIEEAVHKTHPNIDVVVHAKPVETEDESIADKVRLIVMQRGLRAPHNLEVHRTDGRYFIDFDVEFPKGNSFTEAHAITAEIESEIRKIVQSVDRITVHMEEFQPYAQELANATSTEAKLRESIRDIVLKDPDVADCGEIIILRSDLQYNVSVTCGIKRLSTLREVHHIVTRIETNLYQQFAELNRVTIHAEPR